MKKKSKPLNIDAGLPVYKSDITEAETDLRRSRIEAPDSGFFSFPPIGPNPAGASSFSQSAPTKSRIAIRNIKRRDDSKHWTQTDIKTGEKLKQLQPHFSRTLAALHKAKSKEEKDLHRSMLDALYKTLSSHWT